jgi:hypothetical protein
MRDAILAAVLDHFVPVSVVSDASASMTLYGVEFFPDAADGFAMDANGLPISVSLPVRTQRTAFASLITVHVATRPLANSGLRTELEQAQRRWCHRWLRR